MSKLRDAFVILEAHGRDKQEGQTLANKLAGEVTHALRLNVGTKGTLIGALYEAWHFGRYGHAPEDEKSDPNNPVPF